MDNYIYFNECGSMETPFKINNSSEYNNNITHGSYELKVGHENITKKVVSDFSKCKKNRILDKFDSKKEKNESSYK